MDTHTHQFLGSGYRKVPSPYKSSSCHLFADRDAPPPLSLPELHCVITSYTKTQHQWEWFLLLRCPFPKVVFGYSRAFVFHLNLKWACLCLLKKFVGIFEGILLNLEMYLGSISILPMCVFQYMNTGSFSI